jgi:hypothetical protein
VRKHFFLRMKKRKHNQMDTTKKEEEEEFKILEEELLNKKRKLDVAANEYAEIKEKFDKHPLSVKKEEEETKNRIQQQLDKFALELPADVDLNVKRWLCTKAARLLKTPITFETEFEEIADGMGDQVVTATFEANFDRCTWSLSKEIGTLGEWRCPDDLDVAIEYSKKDPATIVWKNLMKETKLCEKEDSHSMVVFLIVFGEEIFEDA